MSLRICDWKHGKRWVYSITYDEALADLHRFAIPYHEELGIPGHVEVVVGQMGEVRDIEGSSFNGYRHMNGGELKELLDRGWGVGNHSWTHLYIKPEMIDQELRVARDVLEEAIDAPVPLYCAPGNNRNMEPHILEACRELGYLAAISLREGINRPGDECFWIDRSPLIHEYHEPFFSKHDPHRNIRHARRAGGWVIDYCHCPIEEPIHINKDCSEAQLRTRLETVLAAGGDELWCAVPEEVVFYHLSRRHAVVETIAESADEQRYRISFADLPAGVECRELTLETEVPAAWCRFPRLWVQGKTRAAELVRPRVLRATVDVGNGVELAFRAS